MESNEKKPKRPRIKQASPMPIESNRENRDNRPIGQEYNVSTFNRPYQPRYNSTQMNDHGGYQPRANSYDRPASDNRRYQDYHTSQQHRPYNESRNNTRPQSYRNQTGRSYNSTERDNGQGFSRGNYRPQNYGSMPQRAPQRNFTRPGAGLPQRSFVPRPRPVHYETPIPDPDAQIRLNKFMANSGICSRREADEYIQQGLVKVNGKVVRELGTKISHSDNVEFDEKLLALENKTYILLNKPKDCVTTSDDPNGRLTVMDLVKGACRERIYPVGRLDRNTTGVLLLTNDGDLASKLTHPKFVKKKIYHVWCDRDISEQDMQAIADGIELEDGPIHADAISYATPTDRNQAGIELHSGKNRIVRRIFEKLGYHVTKLDRVYFAGLTKKNLPRGRWRYLTQQEVNKLKQGAFE